MRSPNLYIYLCVGGRKNMATVTHYSKLSAVYRAISEFCANPSSLMAQQGVSASK